MLFVCILYGSVDMLQSHRDMDQNLDVSTLTFATC